MSMILLQTVTLEQYNTEFRAIDRGLWYTQTEDGTHCFRFDLRFGCVKVFCSKDEVTVRATTFEGKTPRWAVSVGKTVRPVLWGMRRKRDASSSLPPRTA